MSVSVPLLSVTFDRFWLHQILKFITILSITAPSNLSQLIGSVDDHIDHCFAIIQEQEEPPENGFCYVIWDFEVGKNALDDAIAARHIA